MVTWCTLVWLGSGCPRWCMRRVFGALFVVSATCGCGRLFLDPLRPCSQPASPPLATARVLCQMPSLWPHLDPSCTKYSQMQAETPLERWRSRLRRKPPPFGLQKVPTNFQRIPRLSSEIWISPGSGRPVIRYCYCKYDTRLVRFG